MSAGGTILLLGFVFVVASLLYLFMAFIQGYSDIKTIPCAPGECVMTSDGTSKICPTSPQEIQIPNYKYTICVPPLSCPKEGIKYAVHQDGGALTNSCDVSGCPCSLYRSCPAYVLSVFKSFGSEPRISYFEAMDPLFGDDHVQNQFSPPYILNQKNDECFLSQQKLLSVYNKTFLNSADNYKNTCLRGVLAEIASKPKMYGCVPEKFVDPITNKFDDAEFTRLYISQLH